MFQRGAILAPLSAIISMQMTPSQKLKLKIIERCHVQFNCHMTTTEMIQYFLDPICTRGTFYFLIEQSCEFLHAEGFLQEFSFCQV